MAIYIKIRKINEKNNIHYYKIITENYGDNPIAYVGIDAVEKKIIFFDNNFFLLKVIDRHSNKPVGKIETIPQSVVAYTIMKTVPALDKNEFPEKLDYFA